MRIQQYGINFDAEPDKHQGRCQTNSSKIVDILIEDIGVVTASAAHQNKAQYDKGYADEYEHIVLLLKDELFLWSLNRLMFLFFAHSANLII